MTNRITATTSPSALDFHLPDMTCGGCARTVTQALRRADPLCELTVDLPTQRVHVRSNRPHADLAKALQEAGFEPA